MAAHQHAQSKGTAHCEVNLTACVRPAMTMCTESTCCVLRCDGYCVKPPYIYVVMEVCARGSLMDVLAKERPPLLTRLEMAHDFLCAIAHMHSTGFVHRDVKSLNCFVTNADGGESGVRLGDFGESDTIAAAEAEDPKQVGTGQWCVHTHTHVQVCVAW